MKARIRKPRRIVVPPFYDPERDGVTFSLLTQFKACRERTRLGLEGWTTAGMGLSTVYGSIVHTLLERAYLGIQRKELTLDSVQVFVRHQLIELEELWRDENPRAEVEELNHLELTLALADATLPRYFNYWKNDFTDKAWLSLEHEFRLPWTSTLRDGRTVSTFIRGKMDGVYVKGRTKVPWLFETKTRTRIEEETIGDVLPFELQVNLYMIALSRIHSIVPGGVLYNIIRRPSHRQKQGEPLEVFVARIAEDVVARPDWFYLRIEMAVVKEDMIAAEQEIGELIRDFLEWWYHLSGHYKNSDACQNKYGTCHALKICSAQNYARHFKRKKVFQELEEV